MADRTEGLRAQRPGDPVPFEIPGATGEFRIQILNEDRDRGVVTSIVHLPPGGRIPAHYHEAGSEMHYVLEGDLIERGETLGAGGFLTHAKGVVHGPHESRGGAKVLTVQTWQSEGGSFDFRPAEEGGAAPDSRPDRGQAANDHEAPPGGIGPADDAPSPEAARGAETQESAAEERGQAKGYS